LHEETPAPDRTAEKILRRRRARNSSRLFSGLTPGRIVLTYVLAGGGWILFSDMILGALIKDPALMTRISVAKGWLFIVVTGAMLYCLIRLSHDALKRSKALLRSVVEGTTDAIYVKDEEGRYLLFNSAAEAATGRRESDVLGRDDTFLFPPEEAKALMDTDRAVMNSGRQQTYEENLTTAGGGKTVYLSTKGPCFDDEGRLIGLFGIARDITERKKAEETLRESEERFKKLLDVAPIAISIINTDGTIEYVNRRHTEIIGYDRRDVPTLEQWWSFVYPDEADRRDIRAQWDDIVRRVLSGEHVGNVERRIVCKDGTTKNVEIRITPAADKLIVAFDDITERKRVESELIKAQKLESLGILAGGLAHDFNNLLTGIMGNITLARAFADQDRRVYERLEKAEAASLRARDLTQQLLTFSKGGAPVKKISSIGAIVRESASFVLRGSNVKCELLVPDDLRMAEVDEGQISQVINNIIINADQAMPEGGTIVIECRNMRVGEKSLLPLEEGDYVAISIEDQGVGMPREHLSRVFDPYFTTKQKGSGLGLATAYSIIKRHGGLITVESEAGKGSVFHIYLPAAQEEGRREPGSQETIFHGEGRILVMDDEEMVREVVGEMLRELGYEVAFARDGIEAIEHYLQGRQSGKPFHAVILDLTVPGGMGGRTTLEKLLRIDPAVAAVVTSGYSQDPIIAHYREYGFKGAVSKPFQLAVLGQTIREVIARKP
jgi:PAS domain S-box-containing protein